MAAQSTTRHEWMVAGESDDVEKLVELKSANLSMVPHDGKVRDGFIAAAGKDATKALDFFLSWGTPIDCADTSQRHALHHASRCAALASLKFLCERKADINKRDSEGQTPLKTAIKLKQMGAVKVLLLHDAVLPKDASAPGLAACIRQVQLERLGDKLRHTAENTPEVTDENLEGFADIIWQTQKEHQRLLRLREEQRAGKLYARYQRRVSEEEAAAARSRQLGSENVSDLHEKKIGLTSQRHHLAQLLRELHGLESKLAKAAAEEDKLKAEAEARGHVLSGIQAEIDEREAVVGGEQAEIDNAKARAAQLQEEIAEQRQYNTDELAELEAAKKELEGWRADREAAAQLTAKAHKLLGN